MSAALLFAAAAKPGKGLDRALQAVLLRQFIAVGQAIAQMHQALGDVRRAEHIHHVMTTRLEPMLHQLTQTTPPREPRQARWLGSARCCRPRCTRPDPPKARYCHHGCQPFRPHARRFTQRSPQADLGR